MGKKNFIVYGTVILSLAVVGIFVYPRSNGSVGPEVDNAIQNTFRVQMESRVQEYNKASGFDRLIILDHHIDEIQKEMEKREASRREGDSSSDNRATSRPFRDRGGSTPEERKARSESVNPDEMAKRMAYFAALRARMTERGIKLPERRRN